MESGISNKIKVVWICHFSNKRVRSGLLLRSDRLPTIIYKIFGKKYKPHRDFAPWVNKLITEFNNFEDVELHIVAPHNQMRKKTQEFDIDSIHYHFFRPQGDGLLAKSFKKITNKKSEEQFKKNRKHIKNFIDQIKPDIINLIGAENPYYSIAALDIENIPVYLSCQTVYSNPLRKKHSGDLDMYRWCLEKEIHSKLNYFGCTGRMHRDLVLVNNSRAIVFKMFYPIQKPQEVNSFDKEYDFVFFAAGVTAKKGIEDALKALSIVKRKKPNVTLNVVGSCSEEYKIVLSTLIKKYNIEENISFNDYFPVHSDMHRHITKSRFALLPIKLDVISGTVIEAMLLDIPVVTYKTSGTPYLNKDGVTVLLADIGDIESLAENMTRLLNEPKLGEQLKQVAKAFVEKEFDNTTSAKRLLSNYKAVIDHYHHGIPIPEDQLFNTDEFPIY